MEEIWKDIKGCEGIYQISSFGRVRSLDRVVTYSDGRTQKHPGTILKLAINNKNYASAHLYHNSKVTQVLVSRLVAEAFPEICGEWFDGCVVDHIDTNTLNNAASNLKVTTYSGNNLNPITRKRNSEAKKGKVNATSVEKLSKWVIKLSKNNEILHFYRSTMDAQKRTGINNANISSCCLGKRKTAGGFCWKYAE